MPSCQKPQQKKKPKKTHIELICHLQQQNRKQHCKENDKSTLKPGKCSPCLGNSRTLLQPSHNNTNFQESSDAKIKLSFFPKLIFPLRKNNNFNKNAKFIIIDQLTNTKKPKEILRQSLIQRENNFWFQTLDTIYPEGLNQELSK